MFARLICECGVINNMRRLSGYGLLFAVALGILALAAGFRITGLPSSHPTLNLVATDHRGQVHIEWDPQARPVVASDKATLFIVDGDDKIESALSPALLHGGNMIYNRKSPNVEIRLRVFKADNDPIQETARLTGLPPIPGEQASIR
jgi:hypothetical protein